MFNFRLLVLFIVISAFPVYSAGFCLTADSIDTSAGNDLLTSADPWLGVDKAVHLVGSMISVTGTAVSLQRLCQQSRQDAKVIGFGFTITLGLGKELMDMRKPGGFFSYKDLTADIAGSIIGIILVSQD